VSLVAILDADKEGFLRSDTSLTQTIGRAARNVGGQVIMYADNITGSMERAIQETNRRRKIQEEYNQKHGITPQTVIKAVRELITGDYAGVVAEERASYSVGPGAKVAAQMGIDQVVSVIGDLEKQMKEAAKALDFERAAQLRDEIAELRKFVNPGDVGAASRKERATVKRRR
jgi:excinuclease ABC subunit B